MKNFDRETLQALLSNKCYSALGSRKLDNGTSLAAALASALILDLRISRNDDGDGVGIIDIMDDEAIADLGADLLIALEHDDHAFPLPLGTLVESHRLGSVRIGAEIWVTDVGQPGLFPAETVRRDAHGFNLQLLREAIAHEVDGQPWQRIGLPSPVHIADTQSRHLLQFPPYQEAGGVVLQRSASDTGAARFASAGPEQIEAFARSIAVDMKTLWERRETVHAQVDALRGTAQDNLPLDAYGISVRAVAIDFENQRDLEYLSYYVEYDALDEALRPGIVLDFVPCVGGGLVAHYRLPYGVEDRRAQLTKLRELGAEGHIDVIAAAVVRHAAEGQAELLARLAERSEPVVTFATEDGPVYATLFWRGGCIQVEIDAPGRFLLRASELHLYGEAVSDVQADLMVGMPLHDFCCLPFAVESVAGKIYVGREGGAEIHFEATRALVNCSTGPIWAA